MKRLVFLLLLLTTGLIYTGLVGANTGTITFNQEQGTVEVKIVSSNYEALKVLINYGDERYIYNLFDDHETFALQLGSGTYTVSVYQRVDGNKYKKVLSTAQSVTVSSQQTFLASIQNINWDEYMKAIAFGKELTKDLKTDREKFDAIYDFVIHTVVYDYKKASSVSSRYLPVIDVTFDSEKGICYDYSSLVAAMLRSVGVPTKLVEGKSTYTSAYHAWNEVYDGKQWLIIDTTVDAQLEARKVAYKVEKTETTHKMMKMF